MDWECIRHPGGALAVSLTSKSEVVLVKPKPYRFAAEERLLEYPAGILEQDEDVLETIKGEIQEETGYRANTWHSLSKFFLAPGYYDKYIYVFLTQRKSIL